MFRNKFTNWIEEEAVIFSNIPIRWHLIMLTFGVGVGVALALAIKFIR